MNDLVYRQAAIDALGDEPEVWSEKDEYEQGLNNQWHYDVNALKALPSAHPESRECEKCIFQPFKQFQPERKKGKWAVSVIRGNWNDEERRTCPICGKTFRNLEIANYCPNCGAQMEVEE